ncbi:MAG TPA: hypothetical protein VFF82_12420 [Rhodocyclaceae bacterium]|nr:hypothetical protein [Rhodocyclaceae bacterium]
MKSAAKILLLFLALMAGSASAWADRGHVHFGISVGPYWGPYWGPWYYPPAYYYPPLVVEQPSPVYVQQQPVVQAAPQESYWYFCRAANTYYPYIKQCPAGWERVPAKPAGQP